MHIATIVAFVNMCGPAQIFGCGRFRRMDIDGSAGAPKVTKIAEAPGRRRAGLCLTFQRDNGPMALAMLVVS
jgi:hypothetical protein